MLAFAVQMLNVSLQIIHHIAHVCVVILEIHRSVAMKFQSVCLLFTFCLFASLGFEFGIALINYVCYVVQLQNQKFIYVIHHHVDHTVNVEKLTIVLYVHALKIISVAHQLVALNVPSILNVSSIKRVSITDVSILVHRRFVAIKLVVKLSITILSVVVLWAMLVTHLFVARHKKVSFLRTSRICISFVVY